MIYAILKGDDVIGVSRDKELITRFLSEQSELSEYLSDVEVCKLRKRNYDRYSDKELVECGDIVLPSDLVEVYQDLCHDIAFDDSDIKSIVKKLIKIKHSGLSDKEKKIISKACKLLISLDSLDVLDSVQCASNYDYIKEIKEQRDWYSFLVSEGW